MSIEATLEKIAESLEQIATRLATANTNEPEKPAKPAESTESADPEKSDEPAKSGKGRKAKGGKKDKPAESTPEPGKDAGDGGEPEATAEQVREALRSYIADNDPAKAKAILEKHGAPSVTALDPSKYAAVIAEFSA
jgi:hypothetical protein